MTGRVLVASVTVVFSPAEPHAAEPERVAAALLDREEVSTVRIDAHGAPSTFRVDVAAGDHERAAAGAGAVAEAVASDLGLAAEVVSVGLVTDDARAEVYRLGAEGTEPVWGGRA